MGLYMNIYVGNLNYRTKEESVRELFERFGEVQSVRLISDRATGRKKGYGFVEMDDNGGRQAVEELNEVELDGRNLRVNEARQREERPEGTDQE
jgi:RNA recognition motif-containing protein